jgi:DNA repair protein RecO
MVVRGKRWDYIGSAVSQESFLEIKNDLDKVQAAGEACKIFSRQIKSGEVDKNLYNLLCDFFNILNKLSVKPEKSQLLLHFFILKFLVILGFQPELYKCIDDNKPIKPGENCFNLSKGGLVCGQCPRDKYHLTISDNTIKILRLVINDNFEKLNKLNTNNKTENETKNIIRTFYQYQSS